MNNIDILQEILNEDKIKSIQPNSIIVNVDLILKATELGSMTITELSKLEKKRVKDKLDKIKKMNIFNDYNEGTVKIIRK